jgi:hypothetical protein
MIGVVVSFEIEQQGRISIGAQRGRREDGALQTVRGFFGQHFPRRPCRVFQVIWHVVEKFLDAVGILHAAKFAQLFCCHCRSGTGMVGGHSPFVFLVPAV